MSPQQQQPLVNQKAEEGRPKNRKKKSRRSSRKKKAHRRRYYSSSSSSDEASSETESPQPRRCRKKRHDDNRQPPPPQQPQFNHHQQMPYVPPPHHPHHPRMYAPAGQPLYVQPPSNIPHQAGHMPRFQQRPRHVSLDGSYPPPGYHLGARSRQYEILTQLLQPEGPPYEENAMVNQSFLPLSRNNGIHTQGDESVHDDDARELVHHEDGGFYTQPVEENASRHKDEDGHFDEKGDDNGRFD